MLENVQEQIYEYLVACTLAFIIIDNLFVKPLIDLDLSWILTNQDIICIEFTYIDFYISESTKMLVSSLDYLHNINYVESSMLEIEELSLPKLRLLRKACTLQIMNEVCT